MKKIILFIALLLIPLSVDAYYCDYTTYNNALKKAQNVNIMSSYEMVDDKPVFIIQIYNLDSHQYIIDEKNQITYYYKDAVDGVITITNVTEPMVYKYGVYSDENYCDLSALATLYITIPAYNRYYKDDSCKGIENYKLCQKWSSVSITYDEFKRNISSYKESLIKKEETKETYKSIYEIIFEFYLKYYYIILPIIIVVGSISILIIKKRENKFNL